MEALARPKVGYRADRTHMIQIGRGAVIYPMTHPSDLVTGDGETPAITSPVQSVDALTGEFWTANTHYVPVYNDKGG